MFRRLRPSWWTQLLAAGETRASWRQDAGRADAGGRTRAVWTQDAGRVDARRGGKLFLGSTVQLTLSSDFKLQSISTHFSLKFVAKFKSS